MCQAVAPRLGFGATTCCEDPGDQPRAIWVWLAQRCFLFLVSVIFSMF